MVDQAEIHRKAASGDVDERREAVEQLLHDFADLPNRNQAWDDLIRLTEGEGGIVRWLAAEALGCAFSHVPDKKRAWDDLIRLTGDKDSYVRMYATEALGHAFPHVSDKKRAWDELHRLTGNEHKYVRMYAVEALGHAFPHVSDKKRAWDELHRLTLDEDSSVRMYAAHSLGHAFPHVPEKGYAWKDLIRLTQDVNSVVRVSANHSLGRASIFKAIETESGEKFRVEIKNALEFFKRSSKGETYYNPSRFCLPFYKSFYTITFEKQKAEGEVQRYLTEAKNASEGSRNKELLLKAVENLANALSEAQKVTDFNDMKSGLNTCRRYCDKAADLIGNAEGGAPGAAGILRRGLPIINERIREIRERAEALCRETRGTGTPYEPLGVEINKWARDLSDRGYLRGEKDVSRIRDLLGKFCDLISEDERDYPCKIVEEMREEREPEENLSDVATALSYLVPSIKSQLQNATNPTTGKTKSHGQPSQKIGHNTTVFAGSGSTVVVPHTETESGDVTVNTAVTKESHPDKQPDRSSKRTAIEISADIAVHVLVYTVLHHFAEDIMPVIAPILVLSALIILFLIIRNAKS